MEYTTRCIFMIIDGEDARAADGGQFRKVIAITLHSLVIIF
jgi:hypothetical protein